MENPGDLLTGLNDAQRRGVLHAGPPLIVLAGPGTGKTRVITHRVAHMVRERGVDPSTIVAVTFTNKAATELRERLAALIGPTAADSVHAHTFHGFGLRLLRRFPDLSGVGATPEIIDSAQRRRLLRELVARHRVYGPLVSLGVDALLDEAIQTMDLFRHNALGPEACAGFADLWASRLEQGLGSDGGRIDEIAHAAQREERARFDAHARLYALFEGTCRERGWLTIDDLVTLPTRLLATHERVRSICRHEYRRFVVDEFQDVNLAQIEFVRALAPPEHGPDLVVVGDDDQAIYEFRGADDRAFARFKSIWTDAQTLALTENYRSQRPVLDVANAVITRAGERFEPGKRVERAALLAGRPLAEGAAVEIVQLDDDRDAGDAIAAMVRDEAARRPDEPLSRLAVIARTHTELDRIAGALELEGIPAERRKARGVDEDPGVQDLLAWVELLVSPGASWAVRRVLYRPPIGVPGEILSAWERQFAQAQRVAAAGADGGTATPGGTALRAVNNYPTFLRDHAPDHTGIARFLALRDQLLDMAQHATASDVVWAIATRADLAHADLLGGRERARRIENLVRVIRFVRAVQHRLDQPGDLAAFWSYYNDLDDRDRTFGELGEELVEHDEEGEGPVANAVQLLTAHGSKGLEFDVVFVPRVNPGHGYPKTAGGTERVRPPDGLIDRLGDARTPKERERAEERRIFYVAATRAERRLVLLTKRSKSRSKSEHYAQELLYDEPTLVVARDGDEILRAGRDGMSREASPVIVREVRRRAAEAEKRAARAEAASALDAVERGDARPEDVAGAAARLRDAAARLAVASSFDSTGAGPAWADGGVAGETAARLRERAARDREEGSGPTLIPMRPPIDISYTLIDAYQRCPACCYVKHVLGLGEAATPALSLGGIVHQALEDHARAWRDAEAEGRGAPGLDALLADVRRRFFAQLHAGADGDGLTIEELLAWLGNAHRMMTESGVEILEIERRIVMPYEVDGVGHRLIAKLDRVDRTSGGVRIVDYKTGHATKTKLEPGKGDLQLGIYALAIRHQMPEVGGTAEYWMLRTGQRGSISLDAIDETKVRGAIDGAVRGMTAGEFPSKPGNTCSGLCEILGEQR
jgi:DNA helicase-2/ATP-dependent DNA helicase PcrA